MCIKLTSEDSSPAISENLKANTDPTRSKELAPPTKVESYKKGKAPIQKSTPEPLRDI